MAVKRLIGKRQRKLLREDRLPVKQERRLRKLIREEITQWAKDQL